jgi:hypothetical protein
MVCFVNYQRREMAGVEALEPPAFSFAVATVAPLPETCSTLTPSGLRLNGRDNHLLVRHSLPAHFDPRLQTDVLCVLQSLQNQFFPVGKQKDSLVWLVSDYPVHHLRETDAFSGAGGQANQR